MYSKDMLIGMFLSKAGYDIAVSRKEEYKLGYNFTLSIRISGEEEFLLAVKRSLLQHEIECTICKWGRAYVLLIRKQSSVSNLLDLLPNLPDSKNKVKVFKKLIKMIKNKEHLTLEGAEYIMKIKGVIEHGTD
tara:strand:+ start:1011 stop:1409 length:399 start_codon:yes stop_codon:yes gene_type:complete